MAHTDVFQLPTVDDNGSSVISLVLYSALHSNPWMHRKAKVMGRFVILDCLQDPITPALTGILTPYKLEKVTPETFVREPGPLTRYNYTSFHGLLNVKSGHPIVRELFQQVGNDTSYKNWRLAPGVFFQFAHDRHYAAVLGLLPAVKDGSSPPRFIYYPWREVSH